MNPFLCPHSPAIPSRAGKQAEAAYESPFLNGKTGGDKFAVTVTVGPVTRVLDFSEMRNQ